MNKPSQDSLEQQLKKIQHQAKLAEQILFSKNAEVAAAQSKLSKLQEKFAKETERLLTDQSAKLEVVKKELESKITDQNIVLTELTQAVIDAKRDKSHIDELITNVKTELDTITDTTNTKKLQLQNLEEHIQEQKDLLVVLESDKSRLELEISKLHTTKNSEVGLLKELADRKNKLEQEIDRLQTSYDDIFADKEAQQAILDAKLLKSRQELEQHQQEDSLVRDSLAKWQKTLEGRDRNIRIREMKVEQGETKLIQNSELLNL